MNEWVYRIEPMVFTRVKNDFPQRIKEKYEMKTANFTTSESSPKTAVFPNVLISVLEPSETGEDLEGVEINGGIFTVQVDIADNKTASRAKEVSIAVNEIMKKMGFRAITVPLPTSHDGIFRCVGRYRRHIDKNDIL